MRSVTFAESAVDAGLRVRSIGTRKRALRGGLFAAGRPETAARGHFIRVYVERKTRRPASLPTPSIRTFERLL